MALEESKAREHVVILWCLVIGMMLLNLFITAPVLGDLRRRMDAVELRDACRSRGCLRSAHVEECADECVRALRP